MEAKTHKQRIQDLETLNRFASKSKLTKKDVQELSKKIKASSAKKF